MATNVAPVAPNVVKILYTQSIGGATNIMNRWFFRFTGTMDFADAGTIAQEAQNTWTLMNAGYVQANHMLQTITVTDMGSPNGAQVVHVANVPGKAGAVGFLPAKDSIMLTGVISRRYRGGKPRWYQSGLLQTDMTDDQHWSNTTITNWEVAQNGMATHMKTVSFANGQIVDNINLSLIEGYTWVPYTTSSGKQNYRRDPIYRASPLMDSITQWIANPVVSGQRKRGKN